MSGVIQICPSVSGLCVVMWGVVGGGLIVVCRCGLVCNQINPLMHNDPYRGRTALHNL